jgi:hypothetical protein
MGIGAGCLAYRFIARAASPNVKWKTAVTAGLDKPIAPLQYA